MNEFHEVSIVILFTLDRLLHVCSLFGSRTTPPEDNSPGDDSHLTTPPQDDSPGGRLPRRTTPRRTSPPQDDSPGGRLPRRTTPPQDISPGGRLPRRMTPPQDKCPVLSLLLLLLLLLPPGDSSCGGVVLRGSRQLGVVPGGVVLRGSCPDKDLFIWLQSKMGHDQMCLIWVCRKLFQK